MELEQPSTELADRAANRLVSAGRRALGRGDERAAASLLERSLALTRPLRLDVHLELDLSQAHESDPRQAAALAERTAERAAAAGDVAGQALAHLVAARHRVEFDPDPMIDELDALAHAALPLLRRLATTQAWFTSGTRSARLATIAAAGSSAAGAWSTPCTTPSSPASSLRSTRAWRARTCWAPSPQTSRYDEWISC